jgi:hypothetical protein
MNRPPEARLARAFSEGAHIGPPWCGTVYCPVCIEETFSDLEVSRRFRLTIYLDNEAMYTAVELAKALRRTADQVEQRPAIVGEQGSIADLNGNTVGSWLIEEHDEEEGS